MFVQFATTSSNMEKVENQADDEEVEHQDAEQVEIRTGGDILQKRNKNIEQFELQFCAMFHQAIKKLLDLDDNILYLRRFFRIFYPETRSWCTLLPNKDKDFQRLLTCSLYHKIACMYRLGVVLASATSFHFQNVLIENPDLCKMLLQRRTLKICSIGSGCPSGVIGIAKVLDTIAKIMKVELDIFATVVDADGGWKNASMTALAGLEQFRSSTWKINFIQADVSEKIPEEVVTAIQESDIVTMVNVNPKEKIRTILKNVTGAIRPGSMMFILDSSRLPFIKSCGGQTGEIHNFKLVYEELCQVYTLRESSVKMLFALYHKYFPAFGCDRKLDVFARVWLVNPSGKRHLKNLCLVSNRENQNSLMANNYFHNWEVRFAIEMAQFGWNRRGTNMFICRQRENRSNLLKRHLASVNRRNAKVKFDQDAEEFSQSEEEDWEDLYDAKRSAAFVQIGVSKISILNLKSSLKRNMLGMTKKDKVAKKKSKSVVVSGTTCRKMRNNALFDSSV